MQNALAALGVAAASWLPFSTPEVPQVPRSKAVCSAPAAGDVACQAKVRALTDGAVKPAATEPELPAGLSPQQLRSAYSVPASTGGRIAVVVAYDNPSAKVDLDKYSTTFGLPVLPNCTNRITTSCFNKVSQNGTKSYPIPNRGWAFESSLDIQAAHAICPTCRIDLVEAKSNSINNLLIAVDRAVTLGAKVVSMSWGAGEFFSQTAYNFHFNKPGVSFVAASGDWGYGTLWPAASGNVVAAGGTSLTLNPNGNRATETAWAGAGSGCSLYEAKPARQKDTGCAKRSIADIAAVADPATGMAVYSSFSPYGTGWFQVGGTSLSAPVIASIISVAGAKPQATVFANLYNATGTSSLYDVTSGSNGACPVSYLCTAGTGYDGPTGLGTPIGLGAF